MDNEDWFEVWDRMSDRSLINMAEEAQMRAEAGDSEGKSRLMLSVALSLVALFALLVFLFVIFALKGRDGEKDALSPINKIGHGVIERVDSVKKDFYDFFFIPREVAESLESNPSPTSALEKRKPVTTS